MGIGELRSRVLVEYKADVSDLKAKLKGLTGDEKALGEARLKAAEAGNKAIESQIKNMGRLTTGLQAATMLGVNFGDEIKKITGIKLGGGTAIGFMFGGPMGAAIGAVVDGIIQLEEHSEKARVSLAQLSKETQGLSREERGMAGMADDMRTAFGGVTMAAEAQAKALEAAKHPINAFADAISTVGDALGQVRTALNDSWGGESEFDKALGRIGKDLAMQKELLEQIRGPQQKYHEQVDALNKMLSDGEIDQTEFDRGLQKINGTITKTATHAKRATQDLAEFKAMIAGMGVGRDTSRLSPEAQAYAEYQAQHEGAVADIEFQDGLDYERRSGSVGFGGKDFPGIASYADVSALSVGDGGDKKAKAESFLSSTFGPIGEFDAYAQAFSALSGAVGSAMGAWIDGSQSAGAAIKAFIGESVKAVAIQMSVEALKHAAYAIGYAAIGDPRAALHGKSAAMFAAGSIIAAGAAKALSPGAGGASAGGGSASSPSAPSARGDRWMGDGQRDRPIIVVGDSFAHDSPRNQQLRARKLVNTAIGTTSGDYR
jgi:hypothetical protein